MLKSFKARDDARVAVDSLRARGLGVGGKVRNVTCLGQTSILALSVGDVIPIIPSGTGEAVVSAVRVAARDIFKACMLELGALVDVLARAANVLISGRTRGAVVPAGKVDTRARGEAEPSRGLTFVDVWKMGHVSQTRHGKE